MVKVGAGGTALAEPLPVEAGQLFLRHWFGVVVALEHLATLFGQEIELLRGFHGPTVLNVRAVLSRRLESPGKLKFQPRGSDCSMVVVFALKSHSLRD